MSLTAEERRICAQIWSLIGDNSMQAGIELFIRVFTAFPEYQKYFSFQDVSDLSVLREDKRMVAHARNVMAGLSRLVDSLTEPESLQEKIDQIASNHVGRNLSERDFINVKVCFMGLLSDTLGPQVMNQQAIAAWSKLYDTFVEAMITKGKSAEQSR